MPSTHASTQALLHGGSWRPRIAPRWLRTRGRSRLLVSLTGIMLVGLLAYLLFAPFWHPRTRLLVFSPVDELSIEALPTRYVSAQQESWERLNQVLAGPRAERVMRRSLEQLVNSRAAIEQTLRDAGSSSTSVLIVAVTAQTTDQNGQAFFLVRNSDLEAPPPARLAVSDLLSVVQQAAGPTKLVVLDLGDLASAAGVPELIRRAVQDTGDRSLWVLISQGPSQQSQGSTLLGQTVFGFFVVRGLEGEADANGDRAIDVRELHHYVVAQVNGWVGQSSAGVARQTPLLFWGGGEALAGGPAPLLLPVARRRPRPSRSDMIDAVSSTSQRRSVSPFAGLVLSSEASAVSGGALGNVQSSAVSASGILANPVGAPLSGTPGKTVSFAMKAAEAKKAVDVNSGAKPGEKPALETENATTGSSLSAERAALLLAQAWSLRDELANRARFGVSPVDFAPHLWREFEVSLLTAERMLRNGSPAAATKIADFLEREILPLQSTYDPRLPLLDDPQTLAERISAELPRHVAVLEPLSLGAAEVLSGRSQTPLPEAVSKCVATFDGLVQKSFTRAELEAWAASEAAIDCTKLREVHLAHRLAAEPEIDALFARRLLTVVRAGERAAAMSGAGSPWFRTHLLEADRWTVEAERAAFDRVHGDWKLRAEGLLTRAAERFEQVRLNTARLTAITQLRADLVYRAPIYVQLCRAWRHSDPPTSMNKSECEKLLEALSHLGNDLDDPQPESWQAMTQMANEIERLKLRIESPWQRSRLFKEFDGEPKAGQAGRWDVLLSTSLPDAEMRVQLIVELPEREAELARRFASPAELRPDGKSTQGEVAFDDLSEQLSRLAFSVASPPLAAAKSNSLLDLMEGAAFAERELMNPALRRESLAKLRAALQAARLINARKDGSVRWPRVGQVLADAEQFQMLELGYERVLAARRGARSEEASYQTELARTYRKLAASIVGQPPLADPATPPARVDAPLVGSLMESASIDLPIEFVSQRSYDLPLWLGVDYDSESLSIEALGIADVVDLPGADISDPTVELPKRSPTFTLLPAAKQSLRLRVRRRELPALPARIVLYVASRETVTRHLIEIDLPTRPRTKLLVNGTSGTWAEDSSGTLLQPFANRTTSYELEMANRTSEPLAVEVQLFAPRLPVGALPPGGVTHELAQRILARLEAQQPVGITDKMTLAADALRIPLAFALPKPKEDKKPLPPTGTESAVSASENPPAKDAPISIAHGLIAVVNDLALNRAVLLHLPAWPQKPRRFLKATAGYDEKQERVVIHVTPQDAALLPSGPVRIRADFGDTLAMGAQARTEDVIQGPQFTGLLYGEISSAQGRVVTVHVDVDDYPRAFTFEVPCFADAANIAEQTDRINLQIVRLPNGNAYKAPAGKIPIELRVDVPPMAELSGTDLLEVGIDERRDRELVGDAAIRLRADRQAEVWLLPLAPESLLKLKTRVSDLRVELPAPGLQNAKVNVLAHARIGDRRVYSQPMELLLDGAAPRYELPQLLPSRAVLAGAEVTLSVLMVDEGESGVAKVEMAIDAAGVGTFQEKPAPVSAMLNKAGRWEAKLDTKDLVPGTYTILIRAADQVGNTSEFLPLKGLTILTPTMEGDATTNTISGRAQFGTKAVEGFEVLLEGPGKPAPVKTDAQGRFVVKNIPPGKYKLTVKGVVRNKPSIAQADVDVKAPPAVLSPLELQVR